MSEVRTDEAGWVERAALLVRASPRRGHRARVVAVEGRSGSGKSTVAERLRGALAALGEPVAPLTMEELYPGWAGLSRSPDLLRTWVLEPLRAGRPVAWRRYDWERGSFEEEWTTPSVSLARGGTLLVEGCGSGAGAVRDLVDVLVWVTAPDEVRAARLDAREDADLYAPFRQMWARQEEALYAGDPPCARADLVVRNPTDTAAR
ncbi:uridine kinase [Nocardiopsis sp. MG754419]|uniref:uridine kinase family protein n=1 Tax=Nocardiopsis sp. MG754419 TaxID=2259865 RepID=UPI001BAD226D|nr:AAA family ATPase [Nocardiopsis sp. MG754419]MBR8744648.1 phosphoribulokinase [Nocardiopsis sp. MG754419]